MDEFFLKLKNGILIKVSGTFIGGNFIAEEAEIEI